VTGTSPTPPRETRLTPLHREAGAPLIEADGFLLPERFDDPAEEDRRLRETVGIIDETRRGTLFLQGKKVSEFLQRLVTSDVRALKPGHGQPSALLTGKGKLLAVFELYKHSFPGEDERYSLTFGEPLREETWRALEKYAVLEDIRLLDSAEKSIISVQGPRAAEVFREDIDQGTLPVEAFREEEVFWSGMRLWFRRAGATPAGGFEIHNSHPQLWTALVREARALGGGPVGWQAAESQRIEARVPRWGVDFDGQNFPNEAGWDEAVSYTKGCYIGQEVLARMRTYGHVNRKLMALEFPDARPAPPGTKLFHSGKEAGSITSSTVSRASNRTVGLGFLRAGAWEPGTRISAGAAEAPPEVVVAGPPRLRGLVPPSPDPGPFSARRPAGGG
jgi:folate-binding protein YgfZ